MTTLRLEQAVWAALDELRGTEEAAIFRHTNDDSMGLCIGTRSVVASNMRLYKELEYGSVKRYVRELFEAKFPPAPPKPAAPFYSKRRPIFRPGRSHR